MLKPTSQFAPNITPPPPPPTLYVVNVEITKINGVAPLPDMDISAGNLVVEGTAKAEATGWIYDPGAGEYLEDLPPADVTDSLTVFIQFGNSGTNIEALSSTNWKTWSLSVPVPLGNADANSRLTIKAMAQYLTTSHQAAATQTVLLDTHPPKLTLLRPLPDQTIELKGNSVDVPLKLNAIDDRGVTEVKWSLDGNNFQAIALDQKGDGTANIPVSAAGKHTITVIATDHFNHSSEAKVTVDVTLPFTPVDPDDITGPIAYLADLLAYAGKSINTGGSMPAENQLPAAADFATIFCQRFVELINPDNRAVGLQNVHQLRIAVAVLRDYLIKRVQQWRDHPEQLLAGETDYRQHAYSALLNYLGTSSDELRRALTGSATGKTALAERLGIGSDALQNLLLTADQITEASLEQWFGLADSHFLRDPFAATVISPQLLLNRQAYIRAIWRQQDDQIRHPQFTVPMPVIDPDLLNADDLGSKSARDLFLARQQQLQTVAKALQDLPGTGLAKFEAAIELALKAGAAAKFKTLLTQYQAGQAIAAELLTLYLEFPAFLYLTNIYAMLTTGGTALVDEWEQSFAILVQAQKLRDFYPAWRAQEIERALALGPDDFILSPPTATPPLLPKWRASVRARQDWVLRLSARIDQDADAVQQLKSVVDSAENVALPVLRDYLLSLVRQAANHGPDIDTAELLTSELFIDLKASPATRMSWVSQATETLQGILFAVRMGRLATLAPVIGTNPAKTWQLVDNNIAGFDEEWQWMGSLASWRSAMNVFLFPENFLQPDLRPMLPLVPGQSETYRTKLVAPLRGSMRITRQQARELANAYLAELSNNNADAKTVLSKTFDVNGNEINDVFVWQEPTIPAHVEALRRRNNYVFSKIIPLEAENWLKELFYFVPLILAQHLEQSGEYQAALDWYQAVYAHNLPANQKIYKGLIDEESVSDDFARTDDWLTADFNPHKVAQTRRNIYTRYTIRALSQCLLTYADDQFGQETVESIPLARDLYVEAIELLSLPDMLVNSKLGDKNLENALLQSLRTHAGVNLLKLRNGLNIAGLERPQQTMSTVQVVTRRPTLYRYPVLIERAKQLTATAAQIEASFLAALEKYDAEHYALVKAQQDAELSQLQVQLQNLRKTEASHSVDLAKDQRDKTQLQVQYYQGLIDNGLNFYEEASLAAHAAGGLLHGLGAIISNPLSGIGQALDSAASAAASQASFERREQEWKQQLSLSNQDMTIGNQQIKLANDQMDITTKEVEIASKQDAHATFTVTLLSTKFTNAHLYDWMKRMLQRVYAYFLQQATAIARLAEAQLAFERQQALPSFIQADYWQAPDENSNGQGTNRNGLTGSARLLQAITELDQYAFLNDRRKLQMSKTFSLAALSPAEFQSFRETGVMPFATTKEQFDRDFPGHYLRLIRQVRTTVIALIPPTLGIHATLFNLGVSRVTINDAEFKDVEIHHGPQAVALTSAINASGMFDMNQPSEQLQPFEAIGVDTSWEFSLPKPANPFDFDTIADVLITIDYTALDSWNYRQQVIQRLPSTISADKAFSFRNQFPDQWYDFNHPDQISEPMVVHWTTLRNDFSPNLLDIKIAQVALYFVFKDDDKPNLPVNYLRFTEQNAGSFVGGNATAINGIVSTRRGNAANWTAMIGKSPFGEWTLALTDSLADGRTISQLLADEAITDIILVVTYAGRFADWPR
jgi:hypothetical protein